MFIAANWKMNLDKKSILEFSKNLNNFKFSKKVKSCIFPPMTYIDYLKQLIKNLPLSVGGQNCHFETSGAFTGEVSPKFLKDIGCEYVIVGHSERRKFNNEKNKEIKLRAEAAINAKLAEVQADYDNKFQTHLIDRVKEYSSVLDQLDQLWHDIDEGKLDKTGSFYTTIKTIKDKYPKPS